MSSKNVTVVVTLSTVVFMAASRADISKHLMLICIALQLAFRRTPDHIFELADLHTPCKLHFKYTYLEAPPSSIARAGLEFSERVARLKPWPAIALPAPPVKPAQSCRLRFIMLGCSICVGLGGLP